MYTHVVVGLVTFKIVMHKIYSISSFSQLTNLIYNGTYTPQNENLTSCLLYYLCSFARSLAACVLCFYLFGCSHSHVSSQDRKFGTHPYFFKKMVSKSNRIMIRCARRSSQHTVLRSITMSTRVAYDTSAPIDALLL